VAARLRLDDLDVSDLISPEFCRLCLDRLRDSLPSSFAVHLLTFLRRPLCTGSGHFVSGRRSLGIVDLVEELFSHDDALEAVVLQIIGILLVAALAKRHFKRACALVHPEGSDVRSGLFFSPPGR
jgi:hypothetical protein